MSDPAPATFKIPILLVDDLSENLLALQALLEQMPLSLELVQALSGNEALKATLKRDFAIILLDVQMPGMNGIETAELLRSNSKTRHIPIIFITAGMTDQVDIFKGYELGAVDYLIKPIENLVLRSKVNLFCELYSMRKILELHNVALTSKVGEQSRQMATLSHSLSETTIEKRKTQEELEKLNAELELRVATRNKELEQSRQQVINSERLAALGSLVAGVAHEMNTPIGNCVSLASTLQGNARSFAADFAQHKVRRSDVDKFLADVETGHEILVRNLDRAATLVQSFKQVAVDQTSNQRRRFDLKKVLEEDIVTIGPMFKKTPYKINQALAPNISIDSYPGPLGQIITNFVSNSLMHGFIGRKHGTMLLQARLLDLESVEIIFKDDGVGVDQKNLHHIFDPFFTTKLGHGGSGLGLSIVHNLVVDVLGGSISVESVPDQGTTFHIILPVTAPEIKKS